MKNHLKKLRKQAGLSLQGLGDMCGVSKAHLHDLEKQDGSCPKLSTAYAIGSVLDAYVTEIWPDTTEIVEEKITVRRVLVKN